MPRGGKCDHPNCCGGECKQLTDEELAITPTHEALAQQLVEEGWLSVSNKYRHIIRWKNPPPPAGQVIAKEYQDTYWGQQAMEKYKKHVLGEWGLRMAPKELLEERTLSVAEHKAFKHLVNAPYRDAVEAYKKYREENEEKKDGQLPTV